MKNRIIFLGLLGILIACSKKDDEQLPSSAMSYKDQEFTDFFKHTNGVVAADVAQSIPLNGNKSLWVFGDSYIDHFDPETNSVPCLFQVRNAANLVDNSTLKVSTTLLGNGFPASYFKNNEDNNYWFWPNAGYQSGNFIYVFLTEIHKVGSGGFGFENVDKLTVAKIDANNLSQVEYLDFGAKNNIGFNNAVIKEEDYTYVYGIRDNGFGRDVFVARYPDDNILATWEYRSANDWSTEINAAKRIHDEFTSSFHLVKIKNKFVMITTEFSVGCDQGSKIYSYISDTPYGPFVHKQTIWTVDDTVEGHVPFFYQANGHPEYDYGKEELLVTYCINGYGDCVESCIDNRFDPNYYRPKAIRVPYTLMGLE